MPRGKVFNTQKSVIETDNYGRPKANKASGNDADAWGSNGTSVFDPVLAELLYGWFCKKGGSILDPFAGGSVRGVVACWLGYQYMGIDLSKIQIEANKRQWAKIREKKTHGHDPQWICGDSASILPTLKTEFDFVFSCPPYGNLEVYSDDASDLSNMPHEHFISAYRKIISASVSLLRDNRFACFVVGDFRDENGFYRNFVSDTIAAFQDAGARLYNEAILINAIGTLPLRVGRFFAGYRKLGKAHQNVLVFYKGDPDLIKENFGEIEMRQIATENTAADENVE